MRISLIPSFAGFATALIFFASYNGTYAQSTITSKNIVYTRYPGEDTLLTSLDVYSKSGWSGKPVMIWVHGGGWRGGDKAAPSDLPKQRMFSDSGFVFVSINYRLAADYRVNPNDPDIGKIKIPDQARDVARAVAWVRRSIASYSGDPNSIFLIGHSAGAHLVTLISTDGHYAQDAGISTADIRGVVVLDSPVFDLYLLSREPKNRDTLSQYWTDIAGTTLDEWNNCSPAFHVARGKTIPPLFLAYTKGSVVDSAEAASMRINQYQSFSEKLTTAGYRNDLHAHLELTHEEINQNFGKPGDKVTAEAMAFLASLRNPTSIRTNFELPADFNLEQNYPNPFNPSTVISYHIPKAGHVTLKVFDVLGREVAILVNEVKMPGDYEVKLAGTNLSSSIYFYTLRAGNFYQSKKMLLVK